MDMKRKGTLPCAIVNETAEPIVAIGAVIAEVPMVDGVDISLIRDGDYAVVDGNAGTVELPDVEEISVVTSILKRGDKVLILQRSREVGSHTGKWAGVSGFIEPGEQPLETAIKEIREEVGMSLSEPLVVGDPVCMRQGDKVWKVHPFLFASHDVEVRTDWEHDAHLWTTPEKAVGMDTVPGFDRVLRSLGLLP